MWASLTQGLILPLPGELQIRFRQFGRLLDQRVHHGQALPLAIEEEDESEFSLRRQR
jgi:hypothetical protein